jgi:hypothetical protein
LAAAIDKDGGGVHVPRSMKQLPPLKVGELKIPKIKAPLSYRENNNQSYY